MGLDSRQWQVRMFEPMNAEEILIEQLKTLVNLSEVAQFIIKVNPVERDRWLPSILEAMFELQQSIIDEHCIIKE